MTREEYENFLDSRQPPVLAKVLLGVVMALVFVGLAIVCINFISAAGGVPVVTGRAG